MSENRGPLVQHPDRPGVWVRARLQGEWTETIRSGEWDGSRRVKRTEPVWHHVTVWTSVAVVGWLTFFVAHAVMGAVLATLGLQGSALAAAGVGAVSGLVGWAVERMQR